MNLNINENVLQTLELDQLQIYKKKLEVQINQLRLFELELIAHGNYLKETVQQVRKKKKHVQKSNQAISNNFQFNDLYYTGKQKMSKIVESVNRQNIANIISTGGQKIINASKYVKDYITGHKQSQIATQEPVHDFRSYQIQKPYGQHNKPQEIQTHYTIMKRENNFDQIHKELHPNKQRQYNDQIIGQQKIQILAVKHKIQQKNEKQQSKLYEIKFDQDQKQQKTDQKKEKNSVELPNQIKIIQQNEIAVSNQDDNL